MFVAKHSVGQQIKRCRLIYNVSYPVPIHSGYVYQYDKNLQLNSLLLGRYHTFFRALSYKRKRLKALQLRLLHCTQSSAVCVKSSVAYSTLCPFSICVRKYTKMYETGQSKDFLQLFSIKDNILTAWSTLFQIISCRGKYIANFS